MTMYIQVMTAVGNKQEADQLARSIVEQRLAACAQVIGPISSTYWWQGQLESATEWLCMMKTERRLYDDIEAAISAAPSYETPEIVAVPIDAGSQAYLAWLSGEVRPPARGS